MSTPTRSLAPTPVPSPTASVPQGLAAPRAIQRVCDCGAKAETSGTCEDCQRRLLNGGAGLPIQTKLTVNRPGDPLEHQADRMADFIVQRQTVPEEEEDTLQAQPLGIQRQEAREEEEELQTKGTAGSLPTVTPAIESGIAHLRQAGGQRLSREVRGSLEPSFGHSFADVRVHTGSEAAGLARDLGARAFTIGRDVVFGAGEFAPRSSEGLRLLTHELTHTVQQGASPPRQAGAGGSRNTAGTSEPVTASPRPLGIQRRTFNCSTATGNNRAAIVDRAVGAARDHAGHALSLFSSGDLVSASETLNPNLVPAFESFFGDPSDAPLVTAVANQLTQVVNNLNQAGSAATPAPPLPLRCASGSDCDGAIAITRSNRNIFFCRPFFRKNSTQQEATAIHEFVHTTLTDEPDVYTQTRLFELLRGESVADPTVPNLAVINPDSYSAFILTVSGVSPQKAKTKGDPPEDRLRGFRGREDEKAQARRAIAVAGLVVRKAEDALDGDLDVFLAGFRGSDQEVRSNLSRLRRVFSNDFGLAIRRARRGEAVRFRSPDAARDRFRLSDAFFELGQSDQVWAVIDALIAGLALPEADEYTDFLRRNAGETLSQLTGL